MKIDESMISGFAKRIFGFAYRKTGNTRDAEDLSQEIMLTLWKMVLGGNEIDDPDAYVRRVSMYVWSNYIRKNARHMHVEEYDESAADIADEADAAAEAEKNELYARLRREISYLSSVRRSIIVMFYYDGMSGRDIAERLGIPEATVRWHIGRSKERLRRRMEMNDTIYRPKRLEIYFSGRTNDYSLAGLRSDPVLQNICIACAGKPLTAEEIAAKTGVPAFYFEDRLENMVDMAFLSKNGRGEYRTLFLIKDTEFAKNKAEFEMRVFPTAAKALYDGAAEHYGELAEAAGDCGLSREALMWTFCARAAHDFFLFDSKSNDISFPQMPVRSDGSKYRIDARYSMSDILLSGEIDGDTADYLRFSGGPAGKHFGRGDLVVQQFDSPLLTERRDDDLWISDVIRSIAEGRETEKELVSAVVRLGYAEMKYGSVRLTFPYMTKDRYAAFDSVMRKIAEDVMASREKPLCREWREYIYDRLPAYLPEDERIYQSSKIYEPNGMTYLLYRDGMLKDLSEKEKKSACMTAFICDM